MRKMLKAPSLQSLMLKRLLRIGRESFLIGLGQAIAAVGAVVGIRILTQVLSPVVYGELALALTLATLGIYVIFNPLSNAFLRFYAEAREKGSLEIFYFAARSLTARFSIIAISIGLIASSALYLAGLEAWSGLLATSLMYMLFTGYCAVFDGVLNAARRRLIVASHYGLAAWLRFGLAFLMVSLLGVSSHAAMTGFVIGSAITFASELWFFQSRLLSFLSSREDSDRTAVAEWTRRLLAYSWPFISWGGFLWGLSVADRWALEVFTDTATVGLYSVLFQVGYYPMVFLFTIASQVAMPVLFRRSGDGSDRHRRNDAYALNHILSYGYLILTLVLFLSSFFFYEPLFALLVAEEYREVATYLPWMILSGGLFFAGQNTSRLFMIRMNTRLLAAPMIITSTLSVSVIFFGAFLGGLPGVVAARILASVLHLASMILLVRLSSKSLRENI